MSSASVGIIASKPNRFPSPPGVPVGSIPFGMDESYWAVQSVSPGTSVNFSQPRYNSITGQYSGGWVGTHPSGSGQWTIVSVGSWFVNLSIRNVYLLSTVNQSLAAIATSQTSSLKFTPVINVFSFNTVGTGYHQIVRSGSISSVNADVWTVTISVINNIDESSIVQLYYN